MSASIRASSAQQARRAALNGARALSESDAVPLGSDIIHSVTNPIRRLTGEIHVYGGDFLATPRSEWGLETLLEAPYDVANNMQLFNAATHPLRGQAYGLSLRFTPPAAVRKAASEA